MNLILFEDPAAIELNPITVSRPAYMVTCASYHLLDLIGPLAKQIRGIVRPHLVEVQKMDQPSLHQTEFNSESGTLLLRATVVPSVKNLRSIEELITQTEASVIVQGEKIIAVWLPNSNNLPSLELTASQIDRYFEANNFGSISQSSMKLDLFEYPHDVVRYNLSTFGDNMEYRISKGAYQQTRDGLFLAAGANLSESIVTDTTAGPIVIEAGASIGPYCYLRGPAYLGRNVKVIEHAAIKDAVSLGHTTKIGGEVEATVIEPYSNKQHHGFLGHSYLGSWINLGAGTSNSDLKNTYGAVKMDYRGKRVSTDMQFIGSIFGDYAKTAINTGIFTGKTIGVCSMLYGFVTTNVPSFVNYARLFGQVTELPPEVMISTQERMFARRKVQQRPCDIQLLHDMYLLTQDERQLAGEPLAF